MDALCISLAASTSLRILRFPDLDRIEPHVVQRLEEACMNCMVATADDTTGVGRST